MECKDAIELIREHITELRFNPDMYVNGELKLDLVFALEDFAIPAMEKEIARDVVVKTGTSRREYYTCPECAEFIRWRYLADKYESTYHPDRCPWCGQTLKWRR